MKKNNYTYVWVSLIILIFGILVIPRIVDRIKTGTVVENDRMNLKSNVATDELSYIINEVGQKRKVPAFEFIDQDSLVISNRDYKGKVYVVEFFFTSCPTICPIMNKNLVSIQEEFKNFENFGVASFSINPEYDTPKVLKAYAEKYGITNLDWHLMTGEQKAIYDLANTGFYILVNEVVDAPGGFEHSGMFALIDKKGYIRSRVDDFGNPIIYYRGAIDQEQGVDVEGEKEQISILKEDIRKLLEE